MPEWTLKYADARGEIHQQVAIAGSERELRERYAQQGFLIYSIKPRGELAGMAKAVGRSKKEKLNVEKFLIFNQQFVTLIKAGLPILKGLDLLAERLTDPKLGKHVQAVRDEVRNGALLSDAFARQGVFPPIYVTSVMAGEKSGALAEVLDRYIQYQRLSMAVRKKILLSLLYPAVLICLVICLIVFLVTYVVPSFAQLYSSMQASLPAITQVLIAVGTTARGYILLIFGCLVLSIILFRLWSKTPSGSEAMDRFKLRTPVLGEVWIKYQVAQFSRVLSTLLVGGIPLMQALETASDSLGTILLKRTLDTARRMVREGQSLSSALASTKIFPGLSIDMIEVGESTGALPAMLNSVAEFYEEDVNTRMTASLALIEPAIMIFMGIFVAFVLIALYMPIFSLADTAGKPPGA
jgi:type IV pilus assembly protein PilC